MRKTPLKAGQTVRLCLMTPHPRQGKLGRASVQKLSRWQGGGRCDFSLCPHCVGSHSAHRGCSWGSCGRCHYHPTALRICYTREPNCFHELLPPPSFSALPSGEAADVASKHAICSLPEARGCFMWSLKQESPHRHRCPCAPPRALSWGLRNQGGSQGGRGQHQQGRFL